jgi:hypothetical protein
LIQNSILCYDKQRRKKFRINAIKQNAPALFL